jgi:hypothetical protein
MGGQFVETGERQIFTQFFTDTLLTRAEHSRLRSINVDDFAPEELATQPVKLPEKVVKARRKKGGENSPPGL